jgi:hypothetical protein
MICEAILNLKHRGGSSKIAIGKYIAGTYGNGIVKDSMKNSINIAIKRGPNSTPKVFEQHKQSFKIARGQTKNIKSQMIENKRTKTLTSAKKTRKSRPLTTLITAYLTKNGSTPTVQLIEKLAVQEAIGEGEQLSFSRSCKAIITRALKAGVLDGDEKGLTAVEFEEDESTTTTSSSTTETKGESKGEVASSSSSSSSSSVAPSVGVVTRGRGRPRKSVKVETPVVDEDPSLEEENTTPEAVAST